MYFCVGSQSGKQENEAATIEARLEGMQAELSGLEGEVQRHQEREKREATVRPFGSFGSSLHALSDAQDVFARPR